MKKIVLFGSGGLGRETANMIEVINSIKPTYDLLGFLTEKSFYKDNIVINGYPLLGSEEWILNHLDVYCVCTIADSKIKSRIQENLMKQGVEFETLIAPYTWIPKSTRIGKGCIIFGHSLISVNCNIEDGVFLNSYVSIGHDVHIGKYTSVMPGTGISGCCLIGENVSIGGHAFIVPNKKVGDGAVVAAGSVVFTNVKKYTTVLGNPAMRMRSIE